MTLSDVSKTDDGLERQCDRAGRAACGNPAISTRRTSVSDRRVQVIRLTKAGRAEFRKMAAEHHTWISDIFSDLTPPKMSAT